MTGKLNGEAATAPLSIAGWNNAMTLRDEVAQLYEEAREDVYRYLLTLGLHPPQAQEAAQDVFLRLYAALRKGDDIRNRRAWVFRVAHNHGLNVRAREARATPFAPELEAQLSDPGQGPERTLIERERLLCLQKAVASLSEQQRRCLHLRAEGLRYPEIGEVLGISPSTVGEFLRRALVRLRQRC